MCAVEGRPSHELTGGILEFHRQPVAGVNVKFGIEPELCPGIIDLIILAGPGGKAAAVQEYPFATVQDVNFVFARTCLQSKRPEFAGVEDEFATGVAAFLLGNGQAGFEGFGFVAHTQTFVITHKSEQWTVVLPEGIATCGLPAGPLDADIDPVEVFEGGGNAFVAHRQVVVADVGL